MRGILNDNWLLVVVCVILLVGIIVGTVKGIFRIAISLLAFVASIALVIFLAPYIGDAIKKWTPIGEVVEEKCVEIFTPDITMENIDQLDLSDTPLAGYDPDELEALNLEELNRLGLDMEDINGMLGEIPKDTQIQLIEKSGIPDFIKNGLLEHNNSEVYEELGVTTFPEYVAAYVSDIVVNILSFLITLLLVTVIVKAVIVAVDLLSVLPLVNGVNRLTGGIVGLLLGLLFVWVGFLVITLSYTTDIGKLCFQQISDSAFLTFLYQNNLILTLLMPK